MTTTTLTRSRAGWPAEIGAAEALARLLDAHERAALAAAEVDESAGHLVTEVADEARAVTLLLLRQVDEVSTLTLPATLTLSAMAPLAVRQRDLGLAQGRLLRLSGRRGWSEAELAYVGESTGRVGRLADALERAAVA